MINKPICRNCIYCKCYGRTDKKYSSNRKSRKLYCCMNPVALSRTDNRGHRIYTFIGFGDITYKSPLQLKTCKKWCPIRIEQDILCFFQEHYHSGDWIYPVAVAESINTSVDNVYEMLEEFIIQSIVKKYFGIYCPHCCRLAEERYSSSDFIPDEIFCPHCDCEITDCSNQLSIIYQML